jgi:hypothetical protein
MRSLARGLKINELAMTVRKKMVHDIRDKRCIEKGAVYDLRHKVKEIKKARLKLTKLKNPAANGQLIFFKWEEHLTGPDEQEEQQVAVGQHQ